MDRKAICERMMAIESALAHSPRNMRSILKFELKYLDYKRTRSSATPYDVADNERERALAERLMASGTAS